MGPTVAEPGGDYVTVEKKVLGDLTDVARRWQNRAHGLRKKRNRWQQRALAAEAEVQRLRACVCPIDWDHRCPVHSEDDGDDIDIAVRDDLEANLGALIERRPQAEHFGSSTQSPEDSS